MIDPTQPVVPAVPGGNGHVPAPLVVPAPPPAQPSTFAPPGTTTAAANPPPPPHINNPDVKLLDRGPPEKQPNPFERQAAMIVQTAEDWAQRLAQNLSQQPSDSAPASNDTVHDMFHFSPYGLDAPRMFWQVHDQLLQQASAANDPDPYAVAERGALDQVYPYRSKIALLDALGPEQRVQRAEQLLAISHNQTAAGNPPDGLPTIVGPQGLPATNGRGA